mmetsp:Transcript_145845/g.265660  ORF Transcript_145845/g.265660 Transcript_145845/m.265660 type:complete len:252 (-) Transcript_145845:404-1159(-)
MAVGARLRLRLPMQQLVLSVVQLLVRSLDHCPLPLWKVWRLAPSAIHVGPPHSSPVPMVLVHGLSPPAWGLHGGAKATQPHFSGLLQPRNARVPCHKYPVHSRRPCAPTASGSPVFALPHEHSAPSRRGDCGSAHLADSRGLGVSEPEVGRVASPHMLQRDAKASGRFCLQPWPGIPTAARLPAARDVHTGRRGAMVYCRSDLGPPDRRRGCAASAAPPNGQLLKPNAHNHADSRPLHPSNVAGPCSQAID